jgi:N-acetyl-anhydromuramyl-L-alanine amidase AmpD
MALLLLALAGCGRQEPRGWRQHPLADPGLPRRSEAELAACASQLKLAAEVPTPADPTNYGERQPRDALGRAVPHAPMLIVLHETVLSAPATVTLFQTPHPRDDDQASYHLLIDRAGRRLRFVPDQKRAYGAGMSAFGDATVRIRETSVGSINNVALHIGLETPDDGRGDAEAHAGYTPSQYTAAAAQVLLWQGRFGIPMSRLTTHAAVDRSHSRYDPRSFRWDRFDAAYGRAVASCGWSDYANGLASW